MADWKRLYTDASIMLDKYQNDVVPKLREQLEKRVETVHGWWEDEYGGAFVNPRYSCSVCKEKALYRHEQDCLGGWHEVQALTDYCPNCGAKMEGDGNA